jgi:hypothetical protein
MNQRKGATLVEVLAAIFVMGVGLMALLTLFPLGAISMAEGIRNDRAAHIAPSAAAIAKIRNIRNDPLVTPAYTTPDPGGTQTPAMSNPGANASYPVFIDPFGWLSNGCATNPATRWVGTSQVPRRTASFASAGGLASITRWFSLLDDMTFQENGQAQTSPFDRTQKYTWAYLCKEVNASNPAYGTNLWVVVYDGRPQMSTGISQTIGEHTYSATIGNMTFSTNYPGNNTIILNWVAGQDPPQVKKGTWILDASIPTYNHGFFYRAVGVTQTGPTSMDVEVQTNVRATSNNGVAVVMDNVIEVFERGQN